MGGVMSDVLTEPWQKLFGPAKAGDESATVQMRLLRRGGQAFLLLPAAGKLAAKSLSLYPAQTRRARLAKSFLRAAFNVRLPVRLETVSLTVNRADAFADYLCRTARVTDKLMPAFALLVGNPRVAGSRCVLLLFDSAGAPAAVVKAGADPEAFRLIEREETFLKSAPPKTPGVPGVRSGFRSERANAFALDFLPGDSPRPGNSPIVERLLGSWIDSGRKLAIGDLPLWQRLLASLPTLPEPIKRLGSATVHPTIYHGDFAPWNIKVQGENWTLLDWERGEMAGLPLWDWLHFIVQPAILVERRPTETVLGEIEDFLQSPALARYAERSGIAGLERALTAAYFLHCVHVLRPSEGLEEIRALGEEVARRWFGGKVLDS